MITVLKNRLEQKDAALDVMKLSYEQQVGWTEPWASLRKERECFNSGV
jgi:hypothetical protein